MTGKQLKEKILSSNIELKAVADKLNITPQALESKLKASDIGVDFTKKVAKAINKNVYELIGEEGPDTGDGFTAEDNPTVAKLVNTLENNSESAKIQALANDKNATAINRMLDMMGAKPFNLDTTVAAKVDDLSRDINSLRLGMFATRRRLIQEIADRDGRDFQEVMDEFVDNDLAAAVGGKPANSEKNAGKKNTMEDSA